MSEIMVRSGRLVDVMNPKPEMFCIEDIAHSLGMICRFNGHTSRFYSVAEHCVIMSYQVPEVCAIHALLHDAAEAYVADLARPIKEAMPVFDDIEHDVITAIYSALGITMPNFDEGIEVINADLRILATERNELMPPADAVWPSLVGVTPYFAPITGLPPEEAAAAFMRRFVELMG